MEEVTFIIKTFMRKAALMRLLTSIYIYYPKQRVIVLDDSKKALLKDFEIKRLDLNIEYITTEHNIGLSEGRNRLLAAVKTKYFLLLDDDFCLDRSSNIEAGLLTLREQEADIVGGICYDLKPNLGVYKRVFYGHLEKLDDQLLATSLKEPQTDVVCDFVLNFFLAKTEVITQLGWEAELKLLEHLDFFWRAKQAGLKVVYSPKFYTLHFPQLPRKYRNFRQKDINKYSQLLLEKLQVQEVIMDGKKIAG